MGKYRIIYNKITEKYAIEISKGTRYTSRSKTKKWSRFSYKEYDTKEQCEMIIKMKLLQEQIDNAWMPIQEY